MRRVMGIVALAALGCQDGDGTLVDPGLEDVFGADDRADWYQVPEDTVARRVARSVALIAFHPDTELSSAGAIADAVRDLGAKWGLCEGEAFADQPSVTGCSGFLVAPDLLITAGHCIENGCTGMSVLFDYAYASAPADLRADLTMDPNGAYACSEVVARSFTGHGSGDDDYAILRLDRAVTNRAPLALAHEAPAVGEALTVLGYPWGLPQKIAAGAAIEEVFAKRFASTTDSFGGNSGSPVVDDSGVVRGIHVTRASSQHRVWDAQARCYRVAHCPEDCDGYPRQFRIDQIADQVDALRQCGAVHCDGGAGPANPEPVPTPSGPNG